MQEGGGYISHQLVVRRGHLFYKILLFRYFFPKIFRTEVEPFNLDHENLSAETAGANKNLKLVIFCAKFRCCGFVTW